MSASRIGRCEGGRAGGMPSRSVGMLGFGRRRFRVWHAYAIAKTWHPAAASALWPHFQAQLGFGVLTPWGREHGAQALRSCSAMRDKAASERPKYKTCRRYNDAGHAHALTFSCFRRQKFLASSRSCQWLIDAIDLARRKHEFDLWAYVIMPEHVHAVVCPRRERYDVSPFLETLKLSVTRKALAFVKREQPASLRLMLDEQPNGKRSHRFWQRGGGFDRNLWSEKAIFAEIDYIHANPVRRGLCERAEDWAWSSAGDYAARDAEGIAGSGPLSIDFGSLPRGYETVRRSRPR